MNRKFKGNCIKAVFAMTVVSSLMCGILPNKEVNAATVAVTKKIVIPKLL